MCDTFNLIGVVPFDRKVASKEKESVRSTRLLGLEKTFKTPHRNVNLLSFCSKL